jgi:phage FluMu gp28-like protein
VPASDKIYLGVDVGRHHDLTVIWIDSYSNKRHLTRKIIELKKMKFSQQEAELYPWIARAERTCIDATGLGEQFAERAQEKFGSYRVEAVKFTPATKESLAYPLRNAMEDCNFKIPFSQNLRQDFRGIKKETTAAGNIRFAGERGDNGHSDRFWAAALAIHAAGTGNLGPCRFESAGASTDSRNNMTPGHDYQEPASYDYRSNHQSRGLY